MMRYGVLGDSQVQVEFGLVNPKYETSREGLPAFETATNAMFENIVANRASVVMGVGSRVMSSGLRHVLGVCMKDKLPKALKIGPKGVDVHMDERGNGLGVVAVHAQARMKWLVGLIIGRRVVEFPVKVSPSLEYQARTDQSDSKLRLDLSNADFSDQVLVNGYGLIPSNIPKLRLKKVVKKGVKKQLTQGLQLAQREIKLPFAKGADLAIAEV